MTRLHIEYLIVSFLLSLGVITLFNIELALVYWSITSRISVLLLTGIIYYNTIRNIENKTK